MIAPLAGACATPALSGLVSRSAGKTVLLMSGTSKIKNENPDDFATYLAKRQAAAEGREWVPEGGAPAAAAPSYGAPADAASGGTPKAHTKDPTPVSAENNSLGKKGAIGAGDSFEEYMKKRAAGGK